MNGNSCISQAEVEHGYKPSIILFVVFPDCVGVKTEQMSFKQN